MACNSVRAEKQTNKQQQEEIICGDSRVSVSMKLRSHEVLHICFHFKIDTVSTYLHDDNVLDMGPTFMRFLHAVLDIWANRWWRCLYQ